MLRIIYFKEGFRCFIVEMSVLGIFHLDPFSSVMDAFLKILRMVLYIIPEYFKLHYTIFDH